MRENLLFTADIHLRDDTPKCRTDDFISAQWNKIEQIKALCEKHNAQWVDAGDLLHKSRPSLGLLSKAITDLKTNPPLRTIPGNHDQPYHNMSKLADSGLGVLEAAHIVQYLYQEAPWEFFDWTIYSCAYGEEIPSVDCEDGINILVYHGMVYKNKKDAIPGVAGDTASALLKKAKGFDIIISGHNHQAFELETDNQLLINVGCLTRQSADFMDYTPSIVLLCPHGNSYTWKRIKLKTAKGVVSRQHLDTEEKKEEELNAFVEGLRDIDQASLSFESNVHIVMDKVGADKLTRTKVKEAMAC